MLSSLDGNGGQVPRGQTIIGDEVHDFDPDFDPDFDSDLEDCAKEDPTDALRHGLYYLFLQSSQARCPSPAGVQLWMTWSGHRSVQHERLTRISDERSKLTTAVATKQH